MKRFLHPLLIAIMFASFSALAQNNWTQITVGFDNAYAPNSMVTLDNGDVLLASSKSGSPFINKFYKSSDVGANWLEFTPTGLSNLGNIHSMERTPNYIVLIGRGTTSSDAVMYRSSDDGQSWTLIDNGFDDSYSPNDITALSANEWFITASRTASSTWEHVLYKSTDQGSSWSIATTTGLTGAGLGYSIEATGTSMLLTALNNDGTTGNEIYKSTDGGSSWSLSQFGFNENYAGTDMVVRNNGDIYLSAAKYNNTTGLYESRLYWSEDDGDTWDLASTTGLDNLGNIHGIGITGNYLLMCGYNVITSNGGIIFKSEMDPTVGIDEIKETRLNAYPNPFKHHLNVDSTNPVKLQLISLTGEVLKNEIGSSINTENIVPGVYFLTVENGDQTNVIKVIKQ